MPYFRKLVAGVLLALGCVFFAFAGQVPGTKISLDEPTDFMPATQFAGFQNRDLAASILVSEIPAPIRTLQAGMTKESFASRGVRLLETETIKIEDRDAILLYLSQSEQGIEFEKWMLLFGDDANSVIVLATFPQNESGNLRAPLKVSVLSTKWDPNKQVGLFDGLPFRVSESNSLKISTRISNTLLLTENGQKQMIDTSDPLLVVGTSHSEVEFGDLAAFAKRRLAQTPEVKEVVNRTGRRITINKMDAYELSADAKDSQTGSPIKVYQVIIPDNGNYFIAQGIVGEKRAEQFMPQFKEIAQSLIKYP